MAIRVLMAEVSGGRVRGRPRLGWMDDVRWPWATEELWWMAMLERLERVESTGTYVTERVSLSHFCLALCFFGPPSRALVVITRKKVKKVASSIVSGLPMENLHSRNVGSIINYLQ